ncbi:MAG: GNAT family N-acetyltransferase [Candidatus Omnitrophota bacterium]
MKVKTYTSITHIDKDEWNSIVEKNNIMCDHSYLEAVEKSDINNCVYYYPVVYKDGKIVAHTSAYLIRTELDLFAQGAIKNVVNFIRRKWKNFLVMRSIECGTPVKIGNTISFAEEIDKIKALDLMCKEIEGIAKRLGVKMILFRDFYDQEIDFFDKFTESGYVRIHNLQNTNIEIKWKTFDEYLNSMKSNYRRKIIKRMEKCREKGIVVAKVEKFSKYADNLMSLWENVNKNAKEYCRERLTTEFFRNIDKYMEERSQAILLKKEGIPIGCALLLLDEKTLTSMYYGLDYSYNKENFLYFNLLYETVKMGIEKGIEDIDMGITTLVPKKDLGAKICTLYMYMKYDHFLLSKIIPKLFNMMTPQDNTGPRKVFKDDD